MTTPKDNSNEFVKTKVFKNFEYEKSIYYHIIKYMKKDNSRTWLYIYHGA